MNLLTRTLKRARRAGSVLCVAALLASAAAVAQEHQPDTLTQAEIAQGNPPDAGLLPHEASWAEEGVLAVYFAEGRSVLSFEARRALDRAVPHLIEHLTAGGPVLLLGLYDGGNRPDETLMLAARRAESVAAYLHDAWGIDPRRLVVRHRAELADGNEQALAGLARRVELVLSPSARTPVQLAAGLSVWRSVREGRLDLDDFGGADNPLMPIVRHAPHHAGRK